MKQYEPKAAERLGKTKVHPDRQAQIALRDSKFSTDIRNDFYDSAYGDILVDYFTAWISTEPHETKNREHLYHCALALGDVKSRLIKIEQFGRNIPAMQEAAMEDSKDGED